MTTTEHLQRIRARCVELLAIAEKRTPGEWKHRVNGVASASVLTLQPCGEWHKDASAVCYGPLSEENARFIAACAGAAEAGWRSTIAAIDGLLEHIGFTIEETDREHSQAVLASILAAWPEELL